MPLPSFTDSVKIVEGAGFTGEMATVSCGTGPSGQPLHAGVGVQYRDKCGDSWEAFSGAVVAPAADTTLCGVGALTGIFEIQVSLSIAGDPATDWGNCQLEKSGSAIATLSPGLSPVFRRTCAGEALQIDTIGASSPGSVYVVTMSAKQIA